MPSLWFFLLLILLVVPICSRLSPDGGLQLSELTLSALRVIDANTIGAHDVDEPEAPRARHRIERKESTRQESPARNAGARPAERCAGDTCKTAKYRKRPTPLTQKRVAARYGFKCAICGKTLDETWETDHIVPLNTAASVAEQDILNSEDNLQPVHRSCHQLKTSREARETAAWGSRAVVGRNRAF